MDGWIEILLKPQHGYGFFSSMVSHGLSLLEVEFYIIINHINVFFEDLMINQDFFFFLNSVAKSCLKTKVHEKRLKELP